MSGRYEKVYPEEKIKEIIKRFAEDFTIISSIPKKPLSHYAKKLFREGKLNWLEKEISDNYWCRSERRGFQIIEEYNKIINSSVSQEQEPTIRLPAIKESVSKYNGQPEKLIKVLLTYEKEIRNFIEKERKLKAQINCLQAKSLEQKATIAEKEKMLINAQQTIFKIFYYSDDNTNNIPNLISFGTGSDKRVRKALESMFSMDAIDFIDNKKDLETTRQSRKISLLDDFKNI